MKSSILRFLKELFIKPLNTIIFYATSIVSLLAFFGLQVWFKSEIALLIAFSILFIVIIGMFVSQNYKLYMHSLAKLKIKSIALDEHRIENPPIIIFERRHWILLDQLFILSVSSEYLDSHLCLLRVEAFTDKEAYPQGVVVRQLTPKNLEEFILDKARWKSLKVSSAIQWRHIQERKNE